MAAAVPRFLHRHSVSRHPKVYYPSDRSILSLRRIGLWRGMVSESQFLFEAVLLGLFGGITWMLASPHRSPDRRAH